MIYITYFNPKKKAKEKTQIARPLVIGRSSDADVCIEGDDAISKVHALIIPRKDGRIELRDLASKTGTFIIQRGDKKRLLATAEKGGEKKGRAMLFDGESFFIGNHEIVAHFEDVPGDPTMDESYAMDWDDLTDPGKKEEEL